MYEKLIIFAAEPINIDALPQPTANLTNILPIIFGIAGSVALLVIVIGGFRYVISRGDPSGTAQAKNTIIYGIVGLVVVMVATSVVALVINAV